MEAHVWNASMTLRDGRKKHRNTRMRDTITRGTASDSHQCDINLFINALLQIGGTITCVHKVIVHSREAAATPSLPFLFNDNKSTRLRLPLFARRINQRLDITVKHVCSSILQSTIVGISSYDL